MCDCVFLLSFRFSFFFLFLSPMALVVYGYNSTMVCVCIYLGIELVGLSGARNGPDHIDVLFP